MAKYIGLLTSDMRGKIGGVVAGRSRSGTTLKAQAVPRQAPSLLQSAQRARFSAALQVWRSLTATQQSGWGTGALALTWKNSLGQTYVPTGLQLWQQAFVNASFIDQFPPTTYSGSPSDIVPITLAVLASGGTYFQLEVEDMSGPYTGTFLAFVSSQIPTTRLYTKTISRKSMGGAIGTDLLTTGSDFLNQYGPIPSSGAIVALRIVPIHPTTYVSGTEFQSNITVS
jgi:hypothetical protein